MRQRMHARQHSAWNWASAVLDVALDRILSNTVSSDADDAGTAWVSSTRRRQAHVRTARRVLLGVLVAAIAVWSGTTVFSMLAVLRSATESTEEALLRDENILYLTADALSIKRYERRIDAADDWHLNDACAYVESEHMHRGLALAHRRRGSSHPDPPYVLLSNVFKALHERMRADDTISFAAPKMLNGTTANPCVASFRATGGSGKIYDMINPTLVPLLERTTAPLPTTTATLAWALYTDEPPERRTRPRSQQVRYRSAAAGHSPEVVTFTGADVHLVSDGIELLDSRNYTPPLNT